MLLNRDYVLERIQGVLFGDGISDLRVLSSSLCILQRGIYVFWLELVPWV